MPEIKSAMTIGVYYDGGFFSRVNDYYLHMHERRALISISGLHEFIRHEVGKRERVPAKYCQITEAHHFRGHFSAADASAHGGLRRASELPYRLLQAGVTCHLFPMSRTFSDNGRPNSWREKGVDIAFALHAFVLPLVQKIDAVVLITGDGDFVPLVRILQALGVRVMVLAWHLYDDDSQRYGTRTARALIEAATYPLMMNDIIEDRSRRTNPMVERLFVPTKDTPSPRQAHIPRKGPNATGGGSHTIEKKLGAHGGVCLVDKRIRRPQNCVANRE